MTHLRREIVFVVYVLCALSSAGAAAQSAVAERVRNATIVLDEIMAAPDQAIPQAVLDKAEAIAVFPSTIKGGFVLAAQRGKGIISVRDRDSNTWSLPAFLTMTGGGIGAQIGAQAIDVVLVVMNRRGLENLLQNQFKVGASGEVTGGPVGRSAEASTDIQMRAQILSYSRSRGLFAGVSLNGAAIREDRDANEDYYGQPYRSRSVVLDKRATMPTSHEEIDGWWSSLAKYVKK
jgi:lipid-binding SYLF domain-containing protein